MKTIEKRINRLEQQRNPEKLPIIKRVLYDSKEQVDYPERFKKVLISESVGESGCRSELYEQVRINESE